jgi:hypothetical protein
MLFGHLDLLRTIPEFQCTNSKFLKQKDRAVSNKCNC